MLLLSSIEFFSKIMYFFPFHSITIRVSNSLDPDQARQSVGLDLGPNSLQRLSADDKSLHAGKFLMFLWLSADFFSKLTFPQKILSGTQAGSAGSAVAQW